MAEPRNRNVDLQDVHPVPGRKQWRTPRVITSRLRDAETKGTGNVEYSSAPNYGTPS